MEVIKTYCKICNCKCGILAHVADGTILKVEGDPDCEKNRGALCVKGRAMLELLYDQDRLKYPIKKEAGRWKRITWEDALREIAGRLLSIKKKSGAESVAIYRGMAVYSALLAIYLQRFINFYGTPNMASNASLCVSSKAIASRYTFGKGLTPCGDFRNSKCILLFGTNPPVTGMHRTIRVTRDILEAKRRGAKLIVVDPRRTESASKADIYTTIRPGTDGALVLGLINVIIENRLWDEDFVSKYTMGFERISEFVKNYTPEKVEKITWVKKNLIKQIAMTYGTIKPACADRREGVIHHENGTQACRAINILNTITGNVDIEGGIKLNLNMFDRSNPQFDKSACKGQASCTVASISGRNPITQDFPTDIPRAILEETPYPIKALLVIGGNPLLSWPNTNVVLKALKKVDFLVLIDIYRNETASFADFVLPAATFLEKTDIQAPDLAVPLVLQLQQKVIEPLYESWPEVKIIKALAQKMGFGEYFQEDEEDLLDSLLQPWGLSKDVLKQNGSGVVFDPKPVGYFHQNRFPTTSSKIEIFSAELERAGFDALPVYKEPSESPISTPDLAKEFPLILVSGNRIPSSYLSFLHNLPSLHAKAPRNWVEIHPKAAEQEGIQEGEWVMVRSPRGSIKLEARLNPNVDPRVVFVPYGWGHQFDGSWQLANADPGANVNFLTDDKYIDRISGMPNYKSLLCRIGKYTAREPWQPSEQSDNNLQEG